MTTAQRVSLCTAAFYLLFNMVFIVSFNTGEPEMAPFLEASRYASFQVLLLLLSTFLGWAFVKDYWRRQ